MWTPSTGNGLSCCAADPPAQQERRQRDEDVHAGRHEEGAADPEPLQEQERDAGAAHRRPQRVDRVEASHRPADLREAPRDELAQRGKRSAHECCRDEQQEKAQDEAEEAE